MHIARNRGVVRSEVTAATSHTQSRESWLQRSSALAYTDPLDQPVRHDQQQRTRHRVALAKSSHMMAAPTIGGALGRAVAASHTMSTPTPMSFAIQMYPGHTTPAAAQVLNTAELLDLILSNLSLTDILFRATLMCRGFNNTIETSPVIEGILAMTRLLSPALYTTDRTQYSQTMSADRSHIGGRLLCLNFEPIAIGKLVSSTKFRSLPLPVAKMKRAFWWLKRPDGDYLIHDEFLPADLDAGVVTLAGLLRRIIERERVEMTHFGFEVTEVDIWYEG
jgi:hypothetical protein